MQSSGHDEPLTAQTVRARLETCGASAQASSVLFDDDAAGMLESVGRNIENYIGALTIPVGVIGPLSVNGTHGPWNGYVPLATTEAALVASYGRGAKTITEAGGCAARVTAAAISRAPAFTLSDLPAALRFAEWMTASRDALAAAAARTTRYGRLIAVDASVEGNRVYASLQFTTGEAAGQNMVTIATHAVCEYVLEHSPVPICGHFIEANFSGDKKATTMSLLGVRGRRVSAEVRLDARAVERNLHTTPELLCEYWRVGAVGAAMAGQIGIQGHYANALAALYLATGQDAACVAESAIGITRFEVAGDGSLYASVTLPNVVVGTVGGGTQLPSQRACSELLRLPGEGGADTLAEIAAALCLAGELSISAAICADHFARAHQQLARG
ncbi:MAG: 3-hydroxy-3-methylglutaryl CoA reductase [Candidatus Eremiobacteraeota bacterium]|nr:3-hydroxy-3-methylglutaryl CoA reductase [Candidatus Eremiobacteraeota bacterium]